MRTLSSTLFTTLLSLISTSLYHSLMEMNSFLEEESFIVDDKLSHQIFALLENKFLFGSQKNLHLLTEQSPVVDKSLLGDLKKMDAGKVRVLSIDAGGSTDGILAARSLALLESSLRRKYQNPEARVADFFDLAIGSGIGGILAALLFTRGKEGRPVFTADNALDFVVKYRRKVNSPSSKGVLGKVFGSKSSDKIFQQLFGENTLKDTVKPVLIPCYDLATRAPFLFSRADAFENDGFDFKMSEVCAATLADARVEGAFKMFSIDRKTRIAAVGGNVAMNNPTAAAITHVLNNKQEFPFCDSVEDLLVVSLGNGVSESGTVPNFIKIGAEAASDMVDEAVSMAFGGSLTSNYIRIQGNGFSVLKKSSRSSSNAGKQLLETAEKMLTQKSVESVLFRGKKIAEKTNSDKLEWFAEELVKEQERRKFSIFPTVLYKQSSPRTSSATVSTISSY